MYIIRKYLVNFETELYVYNFIYAYVRDSTMRYSCIVFKENFTVYDDEVSEV